MFIRQAQFLPVFVYCPAGNLHIQLLQLFADSFVTERFFLILLLDDLKEFLFDLLRGLVFFFALSGNCGMGQEIVQRKDAPGALEILAAQCAADGRLMQICLDGDIRKLHRTFVSRTLQEEIILLSHQNLHDFG